MSPATALVLRRRILALALGTAGGAVFFVLSLPLPWLLGAMFACTTAVLSGMRLSVPRWWRLAMVSVLGVLLGAGFTPNLLHQLPEWTLSLVVLAGSMTIITVLVAVYLRWILRCDAATAWFGAAPGGINEMVVTGTTAGGDERTITLLHGVRLFVLVFGVPFGFQILADADPAVVAPALNLVEEVSHFTLTDAGVLLICAAAGLGVGWVLRFPAFALTGPILVSAVVHATGWSVAQPPMLVVIVAQVVVGSALGARFSGTSWLGVLSIIRPAFGATGGVLLACILVAGVLAPVTGLPFIIILLAFVPGGATEMSLIALALGLDTAFITTHHLVRVILVISLAPLAFRMLQTLFQDRPPLQ